MREVTRDEKWPEENKTPSAAQPPGKGPEQTQLAIISLLMRVYDVQLALLKHFDEEQAKAVYDAHAQGESFNPPIYIPDFGNLDD